MAGRIPVEKRKRSPWLVIGLVVAVAAVAAVGLWLGGDWLWHLFLRMHGIHH
ncbi:MAG: hypothetical protein ABJC61_13025 [Acidobacteriota bacterium]